MATAPDQRWATDLLRIRAGRDGWAVLALVNDRHTHECVAGICRAQAIEDRGIGIGTALITHYVRWVVSLRRSDNGVVFIRRN